MASEQLIIIAEAKAKPGHEDQLRKALTDMLAPSRAEPGCVQYTLHEDPVTAGHFFFYEIWKDQAAFNYHENTTHFKELGPRIGSIREQSPPLRKLKVIG